MAAQQQSSVYPDDLLGCSCCIKSINLLCYLSLSLKSVKRTVVNPIETYCSHGGLAYLERAFQAVFPFISMLVGSSAQVLVFCSGLVYKGPVSQRDFQLSQDKTLVQLGHLSSFFQMCLRNFIFYLFIFDLCAS